MSALLTGPNTEPRDVASNASSTVAASAAMVYPISDNISAMAGGLMSYATDQVKILRQAASYVAVH
jgi:hypothetical protein